MLRSRPPELPFLVLVDSKMEIWALVKNCAQLQISTGEIGTISDWEFNYSSQDLRNELVINFNSVLVKGKGKPSFLHNLVRI